MPDEAVAACFDAVYDGDLHDGEWDGAAIDFSRGRRCHSRFGFFESTFDILIWIFLWRRARMAEAFWCVYSEPVRYSLNSPRLPPHFICNMLLVLPRSTRLYISTTLQKGSIGNYRTITFAWLSSSLSHFFIWCRTLQISAVLHTLL